MDRTRQFDRKQSTYIIFEVNVGLINICLGHVFVYVGISRLLHVHGKVLA